MAKLADAQDLKSCVRKDVRVQLPPAAFAVESHREPKPCKAAGSVGLMGRQEEIGSRLCKHNCPEPRVSRR